MIPRKYCVMSPGGAPVRLCRRAGSIVGALLAAGWRVNRSYAKLLDTDFAAFNDISLRGLLMEGQLLRQCLRELGRGAGTGRALQGPSPRPLEPCRAVRRARILAKSHGHSTRLLGGSFAFLDIRHDIIGALIGLPPTRPHRLTAGTRPAGTLRGARGRHGAGPRARRGRAGGGGGTR